MKLNLGSGRKQIPGFKNVDFREDMKPDYVIDLEQPNCLKQIASDSVDEVMASHILEHIKNIDGLMSEIYRVCKDKAKVMIYVPYWSHITAVEDPTHVRYFTQNSMIYYSQKTICSDGEPIMIPYDFTTHSITLNPEASYAKSTHEELLSCMKKYINVIKEIRFELIVNKPDETIGIT